MAQRVRRDESEKEKSGPSRTEWGLVLGVLIIVDVVQIVLYFIYGSGLVANRLIDIVVGFFWGMYLHFRTTGFKNLRRLISFLLTLILEEIPVVDVLPLWSLECVYCIILDKTERKLEKAAPKTMEKLNLMGHIDHYNKQFSSMRRRRYAAKGGKNNDKTKNENGVKNNNRFEKWKTDRLSSMRKGKFGEKGGKGNDKLEKWKLARHIMGDAHAMLHQDRRRRYRRDEKEDSRNSEKYPRGQYEEEESNNLLRRRRGRRRGDSSNRPVDDEATRHPDGRRRYQGTWSPLRPEENLEREFENEESLKDV